MRFAAFLLRKPSRRAGFSLLDVLIGMTVLAIALGSALALAGNNAKLMQSNQHIAAASLLGQNKLEELRNANYADIASGSDPGTLNAQGDANGIYSRNWTVTNNSPMVGMKTIVVVVSWLQWGETRNYTVRGMVAQ